ncbi:MAG: hypothetical protein ACI9FR_001017 [Cryomorphaceae bacterium]|jgi:hypothetical protein
MTKIIKQRMTADMDGEFVVFLIGLRINKPWKVHKWLPITKAMSKMLEELHQNPELGFISYESWFGRTTIMVQYWQSFEKLESYAKNKSSSHLPAWADFNKKVVSKGDVGIWHETYISQKGKHESVYNNMPRFGLAKVGKHIPVAGKFNAASDRINGGGS